MIKKFTTATLFLALGLTSILSISSCDKIKDAVKVNLLMQTADVNFVIPAQPVGTQQLSQFSVPLNVDSILKKKNSSLGLDNIKSVKVKTCTIVLLNGDGTNNFGALSAAKAEMSSSSNSTMVTIAELSSNPDATANSLNLPVNGNTELKGYFKGNTFTYRVSGTTRRATTKALECRATIQFDVEAGL